MSKINLRYFAVTIEDEATQDLKVKIIYLGRQGYSTVYK